MGLYEIAGECIEKPVHEDITYEEIHESEDNLWNFLFFTGYLKKVREHMQADTVYITLAIPNAEVKNIYRNTIMKWFDGQIQPGKRYGEKRYYYPFGAV